jgi:hypothetical protein
MIYTLQSGKPIKGCGPLDFDRSAAWVFSDVLIDCVSDAAWLLAVAHCLPHALERLKRRGTTCWA